ncbi:MAG: ATP-binding protein [Pseudomonadota bacterium]
MNTALTRASSAYNPSLDNLRSLLLIRSIALTGQAGVLIYVIFISQTEESLIGVTLSLLAMVGVTAVSLWRCTQNWPVTDNEFLGQLLIDVLGWTILMFFTGGANNPFISYYIVPLVVSAAVLPWRYTWLVAGVCLLAYSSLLLFHVPFPLFTPHGHMGHETGANVHVIGMWFNFIFSAGLITYFVVRMASMLRQQDARAVEAREDRLRDEQIVAVASLAAGTAHELGTPLSTMTVLVDELLSDDALGAQARKDCELLQQQLTQCKATLKGLTRTAELTSTAQQQEQAIDRFVSDCVERWSVRRPGIVYELQPAPDGSAPTIAFDPTLTQALENLLNNAADSGTDKVAIEVSWDAREVCVAIRDWGPGLSNDMLQSMGKPIIRASMEGLGIGLLLSHATVERYGGRIELSNAAGGGTEAQLYLPSTQGAQHG